MHQRQRHLQCLNNPLQAGELYSFSLFLWFLQVANMLYLEMPAGVGYSYSTKANITTGDYQVSVLCLPLTS